MYHRLLSLSTLIPTALIASIIPLLLTAAPGHAESIAIAIHGGAGTIVREEMSAEQEQAYHAKLTEALKAGYAVLKDGGDAVTAVEQSIRILEDSPLFNAGKRRRLYPQRA